MTEATTETVTPAEQPVTRGFKYLYGFDKAGNFAKSASVVHTIQSDYDSSNWTVGEWRTVTGQTSRSRIRCCDNGFHMSPTPYQGRNYVSGNILALVEARGECDHQDSKSAHADMRIVAFWLHDSNGKVGSANYGDLSMYGNDAPAEANDAYSAAHTAASAALRQAERDAANAYSDAMKPEHAAFTAATSGPTNAKQLAKQLARIQYDAEIASARARYDAANSMADVEWDAVCGPAVIQRDKADHVATQAKYVAERAASDAYHQAEADAVSVLSAAKSAANATLTDDIVAKLGKPTTKLS